MSHITAREDCQPQIVKTHRACARCGAQEAVLQLFQNPNNRGSHWRCLTCNGLNRSTDGNKTFIAHDKLRARGIDPYRLPEVVAADVADAFLAEVSDLWLGATVIRDDREGGLGEGEL